MIFHCIYRYLEYQKENSNVIYWIQTPSTITRISEKIIPFSCTEYKISEKDNSNTILNIRQRTIPTRSFYSGLIWKKPQMTSSIFRLTRRKFKCNLLFSKNQKQIGCYLLYSEYHEDNSNALYHFRNIKKKLERHKLYLEYQLERSLLYLEYLKDKWNAI